MEYIRCCFENRLKDKIEDNGTLYILDANPINGFNFPVGLFIPDGIITTSDLIIKCLTPSIMDTSSLDDAIEDVKNEFKNRQIAPVFRELSTKYKCPMLVPLIPRIDGFYPTYYGKPIRDNDFSYALREIENGYSKIDAKDLESFKNIDEQILNMIDYVKGFLKGHGIEVEDKVITCGYSASSKFANCFAALHNDLVKMVIAGGTSGLGILPLSQYDNYNLEYPIGIKDVPSFDLEKFKKIKQFYFMGSEDSNDPAKARCEWIIESYDEKGNPIYKKDANNELIPSKNEDGSIKYIYTSEGLLSPYYTLGYTDEQITVIHKVLSPTLRERFEKQREIYESFGIDATMVLLPGNHKTVFDNEELRTLIFEFYEQKIHKKKI